MRAMRSHPEVHLSQRSNWLRAAVLGANDGILSTASLVLGVAASGGSGAAIVTAGVAGLVAGALSMAAGEYVSVSSQRDTERADIRLEERELLRAPEGEPSSDWRARFRRRGHRRGAQGSRVGSRGDHLGHRRARPRVRLVGSTPPLRLSRQQALSWRVG
jgi:VIT family protein